MQHYRLYAGLLGAGALCLVTGTVLAGQSDDMMADTMKGETMMADAMMDYAFVEKDHSVRGSVSLIERDGRTYLRFSDDFRTDRGPDLKVLLSMKRLDEVTGETALDGALRLGDLQKVRGGQEYALPEGVTLSDYASLVILCESYSVYWGGAALKA